MLCIITVESRPGLTSIFPQMKPVPRTPPWKRVALLPLKGLRGHASELRQVVCERPNRSGLGRLPVVAADLVLAAVVSLHTTANRSSAGIGHRAQKLQRGHAPHSEADDSVRVQPTLRQLGSDVAHPLVKRLDCRHLSGQRHASTQIGRCIQLTHPAEDVAVAAGRLRRDALLHALVDEPLRRLEGSVHGLVRGVEKERSGAGDSARARGRLAYLVDDGLGVQNGGVRGVVLQQLQGAGTVVVQVEPGRAAAAAAVVREVVLVGVAAIVTLSRSGRRRRCDESRKHHLTSIPRTCRSRGRSACGTWSSSRRPTSQTRGCGARAP